MMTRSIRGASAALATPLLLAALLAAPARAADPGDDVTAEGWKKVFAFAHCAVNVFRAVTPADWTVAFLDCGRLLAEEPALPGGRP